MLAFLLSAVLVINEIMASNVEVQMSPATNYDSWIELYNPTTEAITLDGMYLSDDASNTLKWRMPTGMGTVPAGGFKVVWLGSHGIKFTQAPFKLNCDGGEIILSDRQGNVMDHQIYPEALSRTAWARTLNGGDEWQFTGDATPGATNVTAKFAATRLDPPVVEPESRIFTNQQSITIEIPEGCILRYTTDGSLPTLTNGSTNTSGHLLRSSTTNMRFRLFRDGYLPSVPVTRSYLKNSNTFTLPVISIVANNRYLTDDTWGIAVRGTNGRKGRGCDYPANWNMDWDRPANFSMIDTNGQMVFSQDVDISVSGGWSRAWSPQSYKLQSDKAYDGKNTLPYRFFPQKPFLRNKTLLIRNGGNDNGCRIKDAAVQTILQRAKLNLDLQSYVPVIEFVNGAFKGVMNMREPNNKKFVSANFGLDDDRIDMFEMSPDSNLCVMVGSDEMFNHLVDLSANASNPDTWAEIKDLLDIDEYINYMAMEFYIGTNDWPQNNIKGYRSWDGGRFRFVTFDLDSSLGTNDPFNEFKNRQWYTFDRIFDTNERIYGEIKPVTLFLNLLTNSNFRRQFIDTYSMMGGSVFEKDRCSAIINELTAIVRPMMAIDGKSPDNSASQLISGFNSRMNQMMSRMQQFSPMQMSGMAKRDVRLSSNTEGARLFVNSVEVPCGAFNGQLFGDVLLRAEAPGGYRFAGWTSSEKAVEDVFPMTPCTWHYYDQGSMDGQNWKANDYDDSSWKLGSAPLGYNMSGIKTTLDYGSDANNKRPTYYFRKSFTLKAKPKSDDLVLLDYQVDDGMVVYINGVEAGRVNMNAGTPSYNTWSSTYAAATPVEGTLTIRPSLLQEGKNEMAVEVHNTSATSSDIYWAARLRSSVGMESEGPQYVSTEPEMALPSSGAATLTACFEPLDQASRRAEGITPVRINEVSAANDMAVNDNWKRTDWVELVNTTADSIDVEGMYLSDNAAKPHKYAITKGETTANTVIPPGGHLIVWCDKVSGNSQLHASFKLAAEGGTVLLTAADDSWSDALAYSAHNGQESCGRYPDGSANVYHFSLPTIGEPNMLTSYAQAVDQSEAQGIHTVKASIAQTLIVRYVQGELIIRSNTDGPVSATILTLSGQTLSTTGAHIQAGRAAIQARNLRPGCYMASISRPNGTRATTKFIVE